MIFILSLSLSLPSASKLVYQFASLRKLVLTHDENHSNPKNGQKKVAFQKPELIITQNTDIVDESRKHAFLKYPVSLTHIREFINLNSKFLTFLEGGKILFNPKFETKGVSRSVNELPLHLFDKVSATDDADIWEFDDNFADKDLVYGAIVNR